MLTGFALMNYSLIVFYKEDYYYSSGYKIQYDQIDKIIREKEYVTADGMLYFCRLEKEGKVIGCEKLLVHDYIFLEKMI